MRRKLGILFLIGITVLAGTQEATRQFDGLKSSLKNFTRASLWSGLIVYAQPVSDGKLPSPQIYYLMPPPQQRPQTPAAQQQPALADNGATAAPRHEAANNHGAEAAATTVASNPDAVALAATRADEDAAKSELVLDKLPLNSLASHFAPLPPPQPARQPAPPPQPDRVRMYEEVAKHAPLAARKFKQDADLIERVYVKELEAAKLVAETERLLAEEGHLERLKLNALGEVENLHRRMDVRVLRRQARSERHAPPPRVIHRPVGTRGVALPEMSSIGCEKTRVTPEVVPAPAAAPLAKRSVQMIVEPEIELGLPAASNATGNSWTLNCDTEPEQN